MSFKPQFAYPTPAGFRDETFIVPFRFIIPGDGLLQRQLPLQLDDDQPFIIRAIFFEQISLLSTTPGLCRIWDSIGNPLSKDLVLGLGMWANGGQNSQTTVFANGFPIEPDVECAPGGALFFDFQVQTNETVASIQIVGGLGGSVIIQAGVMGTAGNDGRTIAFVDPGAPNAVLSVVVVGNNVTVNLATDGASAITTTYSELAQAINSDPDTYGIQSAWFEGTDSVVDAIAPTALDPNGAASTPITLDGSLFGVKRFREC